MGARGGRSRRYKWRDRDGTYMDCNILYIQYSVKLTDETTPEEAQTTSFQVHGKQVKCSS